MSRRLNPEHLIPIAAVALIALVAAACTIRLRNDEAAELRPSRVSREPDPFAAKLERCRTVTPEQSATFEDCRRVWAENRQRFFTSTNPHWDAPAEGKLADPSLAVKHQDRILQSEPNRGPSETR